MENYLLLDCADIVEGPSGLSYKLYLVDRSFCVSVSMNGNSFYLTDFTANPSFARFVFDRLVGERVYPYHLRDVVSDLVQEYDPNRCYRTSPRTRKEPTGAR